ncbi:hypothetical protein CEJ63_24130, partial [Acinetobacter baumannii]
PASAATAVAAAAPALPATAAGAWPARSTRRPRHAWRADRRAGSDPFANGEGSDPNLPDPEWLR